MISPKGWKQCRGQLISIIDNQALYALLGNRYGGNGNTNFALPNLEGAKPLPQMKYYIAVTGILPPKN